jgi:hypothetical protein
MAHHYYSSLPKQPYASSRLRQYTSGKQAFGQAPLVPDVIWAGTKGLATSPDIRRPARHPLVPVR